MNKNFITLAFQFTHNEKHQLEMHKVQAFSSTDKAIDSLAEYVNEIKAKVGEDKVTIKCIKISDEVEHAMQLDVCNKPYCTMFLHVVEVE